MKKYKEYRTTCTIASMQMIVNPVYGTNDDV